MSRLLAVWAALGLTAFGFNGSCRVGGSAADIAVSPVGHTAVAGPYMSFHFGPSFLSVYP